MTIRLLFPEQMPRLSGIRVPQELYTVLQDPAPLAGMAYPSWPPAWEDLYGLGLRHIVCLTHEHPPYDPRPLELLFSARLEDLIGRRHPEDPTREARWIGQAARAATSRLNCGEGVVVHCAGGTGRTGVVLGCILRQLGLSGGEIVRYLNLMNQLRGKDGWPESPWQAALVEGYEASSVSQE